MYYKLYIDSVFILQMTMNLYLLSLAGQILRCTATHRRRWLGAMAGAGMSCFVLTLPFFTVGGRFFLGAVPVSMCMMCLTYRIHGVRRLLEASLAMAAAGFFLGGAMIWILNRLRPVMKGRGGFWVTLAAGALTCRILGALLKRLMRRERDCLRTVRLKVPSLGQEIRICALVDTGNHLTDPLSGAPVSVISKRVAQSMASCLRPEKYHAVPYRSVGQPGGILPAYELPEISIEEAGRTIRREGVIVAVCDAGISPESDYQMLLHPGLLEN